MKRIKTLGLAAVAVAAVLALAGAGTASAEGTFCKAAEEPCSEGNMYPNGTSIKMQLVSGTTTVFKAGVYEIGCNKSELQGKTETTTQPGGKNETLSFGECGAELMVEKTGSFQVHPYEAIGGPTGGIEAALNGSFTLTGVTIKLHKNGVTCYYAGNATVMMILLGGSPATLALDTRLARQPGSSFLCNSEVQWLAEYKVTAPTTLYVASGP